VWTRKYCEKGTEIYLELRHRFDGLRTSGIDRRVRGRSQPGYYPDHRRRQYSDEFTGA
jgi:hypothetical protein